MQFPVLTTRGQRTTDVVLTLLVIFVTIGVTGVGAYASMFIGINTAGCDISGDCIGFLVIVGWLGGLLIPPLLAAAGIVFCFRLFYTRRRAVTLSLLVLLAVTVLWLALALIVQLGIPGFSLRDLLP
ncbi:hypothetical protein [Mycetocola reblochoni]|uniref:Uncharacterized protein n=2 Tax=Mycetocola reblochoni TaxID=331618 RepID=A0A1R4IQC4_9MICO|nr:hypothetical protein [Mycetocola reblochoni]RLP67888.1 hypothetical protein D9V30_12175 [Mycetocola reblochoni]SJN21443.1 hypothetical protein FM119_02790 [Mycetocola reblochoni REB411]